MPVYHTGYSPSPPTQSLKAWAPRPPLEGSRPGSARKPAAAGLEKPGPRRGGPSDSESRVSSASPALRQVATQAGRAFKSPD